MKRPKLDLNTKRFFAKYDRRFEIQIEELRRQHPLRDDLSKALVEMGEALDKDLYRNSAIKREAVGRLSYKERARRYANSLFTETGREAVMIRRAEEGALSTENMIAEMLFGSLCKVSGDVLIRINDRRVVTADTWDTLDVIAQHLTDLWMDHVKVKGLLPVKWEFTEEELQHLIHQTEFPNFVIVSFERHKELLGKGRYSNKVIEKQVRTLKKLNYEGTIKFPTKDHGEVGFWVSDAFASILTPLDRFSWDWVKDSPQFKLQADSLETTGGYIINFTGHIWGMLFMLNVLNRNVRMLPKHFYTDLSARARLLYRLTLLRPRGVLTLDQIVKVEGWKPKVSDEGLRQRLLQIQALWQELKDQHFVKQVPEREIEDGTSVWHYEHENLFQQTLTR